MEALLIIAAVFVGFSNGANDNFKGFATVWGSDTLPYRQALTLATIATILGSLMSLGLSQSLIQQFSGKGLVPAEVAANSTFILSVALAAASTVLVATRMGLPVSTTHALIGGLVGAGLATGGGIVYFTPKLAALLVAARLIGAKTSIVVIAVVMAVGGLLYARRVAQTMSQRMDQMDHVQGLVANVITAGLVIFASKLGMPVSTTQVSVSSIAGTGFASNTVNWATLRGILLSWAGTLPVAAVIAYLLAHIL